MNEWIINLTIYILDPISATNPQSVPRLRVYNNNSEEIIAFLRVTPVMAGGDPQSTR